MWQQRSGSTLTQVMACCLTTPSHYLNQCWLIIKQSFTWHSHESHFTRSAHELNLQHVFRDHTFKLLLVAPFTNILGKDKQSHPTLDWACDYLSMLGIKLNHVSKRGHWSSRGQSVLEIPTGLSVRGRQLWRGTWDFLLIFLQFYVYDFRFKAWGPTTFLTEFQTLGPMG